MIYEEPAKLRSPYFPGAKGLVARNYTGGTKQLNNGHQNRQNLGDTEGF